MVATPGSPILSADDNLEPFERRSPEDETFLERVADLDSYSPEQEQHIIRITPIKFCVYPEFYLDDAIKDTIPRDYKEEDGSYNVRITRAMTCFEPFYTHLVDLIVGTALRKGVILPQEVPTEWEEFFKNVDLEGHSITSYTKETFTTALNGGVAGIWSEYPKVDPNTPKDQEQAMNPRPYLITMKVDEVLDCRTDTGPIKIGETTIYDTRVTYLRVKSEIRATSSTNEHFELVIPTVVVYDVQNDVSIDGKNVGTRARCRVYKKDLSKDDVNEYTLSPEDVTYLSLPFIPFSPCYGGKKESYFRARPLLYDIARLNLHHWAVCADLSENIHLNASPILSATGVRTDDEIFAGSGRTLMSQNPDAKFDILAPGMEGADVTLKELARIEAAMDKLAAVTMTPGKTQVESGFSKLLDRSQSDSQLAVLVGSLQDSINRALLYASAYRNYPTVEVTISKNFIPAKLHSQQVMSYSSLYKDANAIPIGTFLEMLEAGELFEGLHDFSVKGLLAKMGLTGSETAKDLGIGPTAQIAKDPPATNNIQNSSEAANGSTTHTENSESASESPEA
ncbi:MAG: DUF4055 domain-containing protein [Bacteroidota bacterium]|jgi:hypothetical protein